MNHFVDCVFVCVDILIPHCSALLCAFFSLPLYSICENSPPCDFEAKLWLHDHLASSGHRPLWHRERERHSANIEDNRCVGKVAKFRIITKTITIATSNHHLVCVCYDLQNQTLHPNTFLWEWTHHSNGSISLPGFNESSVNEFGVHLSADSQRKSPPLWVYPRRSVFRRRSCRRPIVYVCVCVVCVGNRTVTITGFTGNVATNFNFCNHSTFATAALN